MFYYKELRHAGSLLGISIVITSIVEGGLFMNRGITCDATTLPFLDIVNLPLIIGGSSLGIIVILVSNYRGKRRKKPEKIK